jgi:hypothetical protein
MLNDKDIAGLNNRLQVPLVVQDVLCGHEVLSDDLRYALHGTLSDQQPDSALLAIAFGARKIAKRYAETNSTLVVLKMECDRVIDDYAGLWLSHARKKSLDDTKVLDALVHLPDDLQAMGDILGVVSSYLQDVAPEAAELCRILMVQADAQSLIAESIVELLEPEEDAAANDVFVEDIEAFDAPIICAASAGNNVIQFPRVRV